LRNVALGSSFRRVISADETHAARTGLKYTTVFAVFALTIVGAFIGGVVIYFKFVAYGRVAAKHLPAETTFAARIDIETLTISEPVRKHLLPLFDLGVIGAPNLKARHDRFRAHTGVELGRDLREIVFGVSDGGWVVVLGGKFPRTGLIDGLAVTLEEEQTPATVQAGVIQVGSGAAIGQASDGAVVVASDRVRLQSALAGSDVYLRLGLPPEGAGGFALELGQHAPASLQQFQRIAGSLQLDKGLEADLAVRLKPGASAEKDAVLSAFAALGAAAPASAEVARPLSAGEIGTQRPDEVGVKLHWERGEIDAGVAWLAQLLEAQFAARPTKP